MAKKTGSYDIPFDKKGNLLDYPIGMWLGSWKKNFEFRDVLTLTGFSRGRSSVKFDMKRSNGRSVSFFVKDFCDLAMTHGILNGVVIGKFTFTKKGANYGCKLVKEIIK